MTFKFGILFRIVNTVAFKIRMFPNISGPGLYFAHFLLNYKDRDGPIYFTKQLTLASFDNSAKPHYKSMPSRSGGKWVAHMT